MITTNRLSALSVRSLLLAGATFGLSSVASAQTAPSAQTPATEQTAEGEPLPETVTDITPTPPAAAADEAIVVTGSRIRRSEATSSSPLLIIDPVTAARQGRFDTAELIQNSPIANGSSQITAAISSNSLGTPGGPGSATVSLRGLGAERTLVLLNGRRAGPAGTRGAIASFDLNVLPSSIIRSVEILKDGASSVYGSDAIAGVVNLITKRDTRGLELNGSITAPFESGGETYNANATWGKEFGRGHILLAADYYKRNELERRDRKFLDCAEDYLFRSDFKTRADVPDPRTGRPQCNGVVWGHVWAYSSANLPDTDVTLIQYSYGNDNLGNFLLPLAPATQPFDLIVPPGWFPVTYSANNPDESLAAYYRPGRRAAQGATNLYHPFERKSSVIPETDRATAYLSGGYDVTDNIEFYGEGLFNRRRTKVDTVSQFYNFGYTDLFGPNSVDDPFRGFSSFEETGAFISPTGILDDYDNTTTVDYYRGLGGFGGDTLFKDWRWDIYGQYSLNKGKYKLQQILQDSISQQTARGFGDTCEELGRTEISNRQCVKILWTDPRVMYGDLTSEEKAYLLGEETGRTKYTQWYVEGATSGNLFKLPYGDLGVAVGAVYRRDQIDDRPGDITQAVNPDFDPTEAEDLQLNPRFVDNGFANNFSSGRTRGYQITTEAFGEVSIPILKDLPFAKSLELSGAARITNVKAVRLPDEATDSNKGNWTYKVMGNWQVTPWVRFRGTYGTSFRAPALFEQFLASQYDRERQVDIDPCVRWGNALIAGTITQRIANNCQADGVPSNHTGGGIQANVFTSGGLGNLKPETSKAVTASVILTPRFSFLPNTQIDLTVDWFRIKVSGEIAQFEAADILFGCYSSDNFPNDPLCDLFERGADGNANNVRNVRERYININEQKNSGIDVTARVRQGLGRFGRLSMLGQFTYQLKDSISVFSGGFENLNGEIGDPKFTGDVNASWDIGSTTFFWGANIIGKANSNKDFIEANGSLCFGGPSDLSDTAENTAAIYGGEICYKNKLPTTVYHNASITQRVMDDRFELTLGVSNIFDTAPPRRSYISSVSLGNSPYVSQYDWLGRRVFMNVKARF